MFKSQFLTCHLVVAPTTGPMARDVTSLVAFMKSVLVPDLWTIDPTAPPMPFREEVSRMLQGERVFYLGLQNIGLVKGLF